jgi:hypothetical protein
VRVAESLASWPGQGWNRQVSWATAIGVTHSPESMVVVVLPAVSVIALVTSAPQESANNPLRILHGVRRNLCHDRSHRPVAAKKLRHHGTPTPQTDPASETK